MPGGAAAEQHDRPRRAGAPQRGGAGDARGEIGVEAAAGRVFAEHQEGLAAFGPGRRALRGAQDMGEVADVDQAGAERAGDRGDEAGMQHVAVEEQAAAVIDATHGGATADGPGRRAVQDNAADGSARANGYTRDPSDRRATRCLPQCFLPLR